MSFVRKCCRNVTNDLGEEKMLLKARVAYFCHDLLFIVDRVTSHFDWFESLLARRSSSRIYIDETATLTPQKSSVRTVRKCRPRFRFGVVDLSNSRFSIFFLNSHSDFYYSVMTRCNCWNASRSFTRAIIMETLGFSFFKENFSRKFETNRWKSLVGRKIASSNDHERQL